MENARDVIERLLGPTGKLKEVSHLFTEALNVAELKASGQMSLKAFFKTDSGIYTYLDKRENDIFET